MSSLTDDQQTDLGRCCMYHYFEPEALVCDSDEETAFFFIVLHGSIDLRERQVHHKEDLRGGQSAQHRNSTVTAGEAFHHFPLVMGCESR